MIKLVIVFMLQCMDMSHEEFLEMGELSVEGEMGDEHEVLWSDADEQEYVIISSEDESEEENIVISSDEAEKTLPIKKESEDKAVSVTPMFEVCPKGDNVMLLDTLSLQVRIGATSLGNAYLEMSTVKSKGEEEVVAIIMFSAWEMILQKKHDIYVGIQQMACKSIDMFHCVKEQDGLEVIRVEADMVPRLRIWRRGEFRWELTFAMFDALIERAAEITAKLEMAHRPVKYERRRLDECAKRLCFDDDGEESD